MSDSHEDRISDLEMEVRRLENIVADMSGVPVAILFSRHFPSEGQRRLDEDYGEDE